MADITIISSALTSIKVATDLARLIKESSSSLDKAEVKLKLAELVSALADAKVEIAQVQKVLLEKDKQIRDLTATLSIRGRLIWDRPYYWLEETGEKDGSYCQQCYDNNSKLIRLQSHGDGSWSCNTCNKSFYDKTFQDGSSQSDYDPY